MYAKIALNVCSLLNSRYSGTQERNLTCILSTEDENAVGFCAKGLSKHLPPNKLQDKTFQRDTPETIPEEKSIELIQLQNKKSAKRIRSQSGYI